MHTCPEKILQTALVCNQVPPTLVKSECDNSEIQEPKLVKVSGFIDCCEFNDIFYGRAKAKLEKIMSFGIFQQDQRK